MLSIRTRSLRDALIFAAGLLPILLLTLSIYLPGTAGGFLFDDFPNLGGMERIDTRSDFWAGVVSYLDSGMSGPTKRPVALASFLLEYPSWPFDASPFKRNNILFHLITTLLVSWLALLVAERAGIVGGRRVLFGVVVAAAFALHPLHVSTVLYVVQRMTILSALFAIAALIAYLKGVKALSEERRSGWWLLWLLYPLLVLLALFSKETGVLVAYFTALIAACFPLRFSSDTAAKWRQKVVLLVTYGPAALLATGMLYHCGRTLLFDPDFPHRDFNVIERLLTQPRVVFSYLYDLAIPKIQSSGLYHDSYPISRSLFSPATTLPAIVGVCALIGLAIWKRRTLPFLTLGVLGYFLGHALESTYIGLEIYFEHRNYLPSVFLFVAVAAGLLRLAVTRARVAATAFFVVLCWLAFATFQQVQLWKNPLLLSVVWAEQSGGSERALLDASNHLQREGYIEQAMRLTEQALASNPDSARAGIYGLTLECKYGVELQGVSLDNTLQRLRGHVYHQATYNYLKTVLDIARSTRCQQLGYQEQKTLIAAVFSSSGIRSGNVEALQYYELGNTELANGNGDAALQNFSRALALRNDVQVGLVEVASLAGKGFASQALLHIDAVAAHNESLLKRAGSAAEQRQGRWVASELKRLQDIIREEMDGSVNGG